MYNECNSPNNNNNTKYNQILNSLITKMELEEIINYLPKNKSLGISRVTYELLANLGNIGQERLLNILNKVLANKNIYKS